MARQVLYLKIDANVEVKNQTVYLKDIAEMICSDRETENRVKMLRLEHGVEQEPGRYVRSVMDVIDCIRKEFPDLEIHNLGENDFILTYEKQTHLSEPLSWIKTAAVCILSFFGAGFSIMTFNNDVNITRLFGQIYELFTGQTSDGFTVLEISYSLGIGLGIILFFNHFAGKKLTRDPTPLEVQMRTYEDDVNQTVIEESRHKPKKEQEANRPFGT